jgi:hypothetical protein
VRCDGKDELGSSEVEGRSQIRSKRSSRARRMKNDIAQVNYI